MQEYHKINSVFQRDTKGKFTSELSHPAYEYLMFSDWIWTEKIDGTNTRIGFAGNEVEIGGRSENSQMPIKLVDVLREIFTKKVMQKAFPDIIPNQVTLYGESYGFNIQKVGKKYSDTYKFILFDVLIDGVWLERKNIEDIASKLNIEVVPIVATISLDEMIGLIKNKTLKSAISKEDMLVEGVVGYPVCGLQDRLGERIITKLKHKDFY